MHRRQHPGLRTSPGRILLVSLIVLSPCLKGLEARARAEQEIADHLQAIQQLTEGALEASRAAAQAASVAEVKQHADHVFAAVWGVLSGLAEDGASGAAQTHGWKTRWQVDTDDFELETPEKFGVQPPAINDPAQLGIEERQKDRLLVLTDIEADPDDTQSLVRLLLYANLIDIEGLVATTSVHQKTRVAPESIERVIRAYGDVQPNLSRHESGFPMEEDLLGLVKQGRAEYGMQGVGDEKDSEGSDWIIRVLEDDDERPLWISVWGGPNTLAQALYRIRETKTEEEAERLISKLRVYTISDQDDSAIWIRSNFPNLFYIVSPGNYGRATWIAINNFVPGIDNETISNRWLAENIQQGHGPLGALYPDVAWGMEGDTPAFLPLIPNGLNVPERPDWGGWGGRYELYIPEPTPLSNALAAPGQEDVSVAETRPIWTNADDHHVPYVPRDYGRSVRRDTVSFTSNKATLWRWRDAFQNDFAARMDWTLMSYEEANHPPVPPPGEEITVKSGEYFALDGSGTTDPDGDALSYLWFQYPEVGSYAEPIRLYAENLYRLFIRAPEVDKPETTHFILSVTDKGTPALTRYKRVIVNIVP